MNSNQSSSDTFQGKTIVVTGGAAFIGSFLVERLRTMGATVRVPTRSGSHGFLNDIEGIQWMKGDIKDSAFCTLLLDGVDILFHLASHRKNVVYHREHAQEIFDDNVGMSDALIHAIRNRSDLFVVFVSTANAGDVDLEKREVGSVFDGYVVSKAICEAHWEQAAQKNGFSLLTVRPVGIYGPRDYFGDDGNVIPALAVRASQAEHCLSVWGSGNQRRSFVYVEDLVDALLQFVSGGVTGVHVIASPERVSVSTLAQTIVDLVHPNLPIEFDTSKPEGVNSPEIALHSSLSEVQWTSLDDGLKKTFDWWKENEKAH